MKGQGFTRRLGFALQGLKRATGSERSLRTHLGAAAGVLLVLLLTRPAPLWWAVLGLAVGISVPDLTQGTIVANLGYENVAHPQPVFRRTGGERDGIERERAGVVRLRQVDAAPGGKVQDAHGNVRPVMKAARRL